MISTTVRPIRLFAAAGVVAIAVLAGGCTSARDYSSCSAHIRTHDPSTIVKCGDTFWVFHTGVGIRSHESKDLIHWEQGPQIFDAPPAWALEVAPQDLRAYYWAPDVIQIDGRWYLYYSVSTFGKNRSAIGLAVNETLEPSDPRFKWHDEGIVVESAPTNHFNTIDPAVARDIDGRLWMSFGSFWSGIKLIELNPATGKRIGTNSPIYPLAFNDSIEASYIYRHGTNYFLFVNWGACCRGTNSTYEIRIGRASKITGPYFDKQGRDMMNGGGSVFLGSSGAFIGPGHAGIVSDGNRDWFSCHFYDRNNKGAPALAILPLKWDSNGWPEIDAKIAVRKN